MILPLVTHAHATIEKAGCGRLVQPRHYPRIEDTARGGIPWAADNDCFQGLDERAFRRMLARIAGLPGCLFVTAPDVVGDHNATAELFHEWEPRIHDAGLPVAFVLQDGCDVEDVPWLRADAVFIGGSTEYNLGPTAARIVAEANRRAKWAHMGRVNSVRRISYAASIGCDSFDGTKWARFTTTHLRTAVNAAAQPTQPRLMEDHA